MVLSCSSENPRKLLQHLDLFDAPCNHGGGKAFGHIAGATETSIFYLVAELENLADTPRPRPPRGVQRAGDHWNTIASGL
ncbi:hypothetical protein MCOR25_007226 [Pyricularia grisea]|nr:hypothetical protein MCOR25_007226 [Pyricularia grisea]